MPLPTVPGASALPFRLSSSSLEAFEHPSWKRAEHEILAVVARGERALLLGLPGTGKTLLLQSLERTLRARGANVRALRRGEPLAGVPGTDVLFVDEAGGFSDEELGRICRRPNPVIMAGLPCLQQRVARQPGAVGILALEPLSPEEVARFVTARLGDAGRPRDLFTPEAVAAVARHSGGLLRLVVILAGAALFFAELRDAAQVAAGDVDEAAAMREAVAAETEAEASCEAPPRSEPPQIGAPLAEPSWLRAVLPGSRSRVSPIAGMVAGLAGVTCAALAVAALAIAAAVAVSSAPAIPLQALKGASAPVLTSATLPAPPDPPPAPALAATSAPEPAHAAAPPSRRAAPPVQAASADAADAPDIVFAFSGPILNDTMGQGGRLALQLRTDGSAGPVGAWFHASHGLIGTGTLHGKMRPDGRITLSGRLMMGRNPFDCALQATLDGNRLVGEATFVRATSGAKAHSSFALTRL